MILDSFSEVNASLCPGAFQELNGLTIVVPNEEQLGTPVNNAQNFPNAPLPVEPDFTQSDDILLKAVQSPFPTLHRGAPEPVSHNDVLRYLNLTLGESDVETFSKLSAESSSSRDQAIPPAQHQYSERRVLRISEVCDRTDKNGIEQIPAVGNKRAAKASSLSSSSKRCNVTQPSKFCHVCVRSGEQVTLVPCANVIGAVCRKAICQKCFDKHGIGHEWRNACENRETIRQIHAGLLDRLPDNVWTCLHCRQMCPQTAQCKIYARTNRRRHMVLKQRKAEKDRMLKRNMERGLTMPKRSEVGVPSGRPGASSAGSAGLTSNGGIAMGAMMSSHMLDNRISDHDDPLNRTTLPTPGELAQMHPYLNMPRH